MPIVRRSANPIERATYVQEFCSVSTSLPDFPTDPTFWRYRCSVDDVRTDRVYPVWFTDLNRKQSLNYNGDGATPILFGEISAIPWLLQQRLREPRPGDPKKLIMEHCEHCGVRVVKDGCHRLLWHIHNSEDPEFEVIEVSGSDWSMAQFDMSTICERFRT